MPCDAPPAIDRNPCLWVVAVTVGKAPPAFPLMRCPDISRGQESVAPGISTRHQVADDNVPALGSDAWGVFQEHPGRSNSVDCAHDLAVESAALAVDALPIGIGRTDVGTREASADRIDASQLSREVHGADIALDDSQAGELSAQDGACVSVPLDGDDGLMAEDEVGEDSAAGTGEQVGGADRHRSTSSSGESTHHGIGMVRHVTASPSGTGAATRRA